MLDSNAHLTMENGHFSSLLNSKAVTTGHNTHTHTLDVRNNTHAAADSQRTSRSSPFSGGSPLASCCEGVNGSEDFLSFFQNQWPTPCRSGSRHGFETWLALFADAALSIPPTPSLSICDCHFVHCGHVTLLVLSMVRGERVSHEGREGEKRGGEDCKGGENQKSISPFHF